jgi:nicotinamide-nucleotide amidase
MSGFEIDAALVGEAAALLEACRALRVKLVTAESCTGGLVAATLTAVPGSSDVFDRGFVTYSNEAKTAMLGVSAGLIEREGAVSEAVAMAMAQGALDHSQGDLAIAVTGIAGPDGGSAEKPVGLVYFAGASRDGRACRHRALFGDIGRDAVRRESVARAFLLVAELL